MGIPVLFQQYEVNDIDIYAEPLEATSQLSGNIAVDVIVDPLPFVLFSKLMGTCHHLIVGSALEPEKAEYPFDSDCIYREILSLCRETSPVVADPNLYADAVERPSTSLFDPLEGPDRDFADVYGVFDLYYNQIWLVPTLIDAGLITEEKTYAVHVWNAKMDTVTLVSMSKHNLPDESISPVYSNEDMLPTKELSFTVTIPLKGRPVINGYFQFTFNPIDKYLYIRGKRVIQIIKGACLFGDEPSCTITYNYPVVQITTDKLKQQRRLGAYFLKRNLRIRVDVPVGKEKFFHDIEYGIGRVFAVIVPYEKMTPTADNLQNLSTIYVNEDISYYFNLKKSDFIAIVNEPTNEAEVKEISSIDYANKRIDLAYSVKGDFPKEYTKIYPCIIGYLTSYSSTRTHPKILRVEYEIEETKQ